MMKRYLSKYAGIAAICLSMVIPVYASAQEYIEIEPLFEYPMAPEELSSLNEKSDYLVEHFWEQFDFKSKATVDQSALNHAFKVYAVPLRYADKNKASAAIDNLLDKLSKNPTLLLQFTKAAEENIYGPRAEAWIDEVYVRFLNTLLKNKKIPAQRKERYRNQLNLLESCSIGAKAPGFDFVDNEGKNASYFPMATPTIIIFGNPTNADWRISRLKMETNAQLTQAVDKGKINILFIVPENIDGWQKEVTSYPLRWTLGCADGIKDKMDIRAYPNLYFASVYFIGSDGNIKLKNVNLEEAVSTALDSIN